MGDKSIKILYISQYFPPEMGAPSARVYELSRRWVEKGASVTVLTGFPHHPTGVIPLEYKGVKFLEEMKDNIHVLRTYVYPTANKGFIKRIFSYFSFMISSILYGFLKVGRHDIIIATSPQFFVGISGYILSKIKGIPFIFEVRDLWPESIVQLGQLKNQLIIRALEWIEKKLYQKCIHIIGVADSTTDILGQKGIPKDKISIIKNGVDLKLFTKSDQQNALKDKYTFKEKFVVSYIGTHGLSHALDRVLETAKLLQDRKDIIFLFVGEGAEKEKLKMKAKNHEISNLIFHDQITKDKLPDFYELSDIILVTLKDLPLFKHVIPSKLFEIMAMERPIIISINGEARNLVESAKAGVFSKPEDPMDLVDKIDLLYKNQNLRIKLGQNGRQFVTNHYNRNALADKYLKIIEKLVKQEK